MKNILIITLLLQTWSLSAEVLPRDWYLLPEEMAQNPINKSSQEVDIDESIDNINDAYIGSFEDADTNTEDALMNKGLFGKWKFKEVKTYLALGLSGKIGLKSWGGTKTIEVIYAKRSKKQRGLENKALTEDQPSTITFDENTTEEDVQNTLNPVVESLVKSGKVKDGSKLRKNLTEKTNDLIELSKAMDANLGGWAPSKMRLDLSVGVSGSVSTFFVSLGGDIRLRIEWKRSQKFVPNKSFSESLLNERQQKFAGVLNSLASEFTQSIDKAPKANFNLVAIKVALGVSGKHDFGVVKGSAGTAYHVWFTPSKKKKIAKITETDLPLIVEEPNDATLAYAEDKGLFSSKKKKNRVFKLKKKKIRKSIKKLTKMSNKLTAKFSKPKYAKRKWGVKTLKLSYAFSISGDVGVVNVKGAPSVELEYKNVNF